MVTKYRLLSTSVTHSAFMLDTSWGTIEYSQVISSRASVISSCPIVPNNNHLLRRFKVPHCTDMTLPTILQTIIGIEFYGPSFAFICSLILESTVTRKFINIEKQSSDIYDWYHYVYIDLLLTPLYLSILCLSSDFMYG